MKKIIFTGWCMLLACIATTGVSLAAEKTYTNSIGMEFVLIPAGSFTRAGVTNEFGEKADAKMVVTKPFYLGKYEVTQEEWVAVMGSGSNPSQFKGRRNPVETVSWDDVQEFIKRLNAKEGHTRYRLPTDVEWELGARAGTDTTYSFGDDARLLGEYAWYKGNSNAATHPVGQKKPNPWGLYDMHGNVWEWVQDWYVDTFSANKEIRDYQGPETGSRRVSRGCGWSSGTEVCRAAYRSNGIPANRLGFVGFRLAFSPE